MPGGGKGKGTNASISITGDANKPVALDVAADLDLSTTIGGGERPVRMENASDTTIGGGERPLATDMTMRTPDTFRTDMRTASEFAITRPIETNSDMHLDVEPVVVDLCFTANIGKVPRLCIRRPYEHHLSLRVFGMELLGLDLTGERNMIIDDLPKRADVAWGGEKRQHHDRSSYAEPTIVADIPHVPPAGGGLHIRLGP
jgi:hypothetical protein